MTSKITTEVTPLTESNIKSARFIANSDGRLGLYAPSYAGDSSPWAVRWGEDEAPSRDCLDPNEVLDEEGWYVISVPDLPKPMTAEQKLRYVHGYSKDVVDTLVTLGLVDQAVERLENRAW